MRGLMMDRPLLVSSLIDYGAEIHGDAMVVSRRVEGDTHRYGYADARARIVQLAHALRTLGVREGDRVATMAWNGHRHFEVYYAASGIGAVCHTVNPRLFPEQLVYIVNHAEDRLLFVDLTFLPLIELLIDRMPSLEHVVIMTDATHRPETTLPGARCYEDLIQGQPTAIDWPDLDENAAAGLCYTSGTTGHPKGVLYSNRSSVLHALSVALVADSVRLTRNDRVLPVVPLFHVNAWGLPFAAPIAGANLIFPGPKLDGGSLFDLMEEAEVTATWGVPTVWLGLLNEMDRRGRKPRGLDLVVVGGAAAPPPMIERFERDFAIQVVHGWGMTETSPVGTFGSIPPEADGLPLADQVAMKARQGRFLFGVGHKIVDDRGRALPHDGVAFGELLVRGNTIASAYYDDPEATRGAFDDEGWFRTGDVATISPNGVLNIVDRAKDVIKSGGEWISSIDLENAAIGHPGIAEAAVIAAPHPKWGERPVLIAVRREGSDVTAGDVKAYLETKVAKWWLPDAIVFAESLPHTATGKLQKTELRKKYGDLDVADE